MVLDTNTQFIPVWTGIMQESFKDKKFDYDLYEKLKEQWSLNMGEFGQCMVGEAHGFNDNYKAGEKEERCERCVSLSLKACFLKHNNLEPFYNFKQELYDHMVSKHG